MADLNKCSFIGRLGKDPDVRQIPNGDQVATITVAVSEKYTNKAGEKVETTEWVSAVLWRQLAEIAEKYLKKGDSVYIEGKMQTRSWDDKTSGEKKYKTEINVKDLIMLGGKSENASSEPSAPTPEGQGSMGFDQGSPQGGPGDPDELPF